MKKKNYRRTFPIPWIATPEDRIILSLFPFAEEQLPDGNVWV